jgi:hypothetical protein
MHALTLKASGILNVVFCEVEIQIPNTGKRVKVSGIWDTGATGSVITTDVVRALGLVPTGFTQVHTANGIRPTPTYQIDMILPNGVGISGITATEADALSGGQHVLIGMDVIGLGDFSITNYKGNTCMSFRLPSSHEIDYVASHSGRANKPFIKPSLAKSPFGPHKKGKKR